MAKDEKKHVGVTPSAEAEKAEWDVVQNTKTEMKVRGITFRIGGVYYDTLDKITTILLKEKDEKKVTAKCAAAIYLNGFFKMRLLWWAVWRWFYYVKQLTDEEMTPVVLEFKKKADSAKASYYLNIISLTDIRQTQMTMTMEEAERFRRELLGASRGQQPPRHKEG